MVKASYYDYTYQIVGESLSKAPDPLFGDSGVYLIVDKKLKLIWIWAGRNSRLFHRYIAANWAGKLKGNREFFKFKYEIIKQNNEPEAFKTILEEVRERNQDFDYPGQSRESIVKEQIVEYSTPNKDYNAQTEFKLSKSEKSQIKKIISEINEIQLHIKYSFEHIERRIVKIDKILES
ncbi:MAG: hypothetical protein KAX18_08205 [Candidatus Lokiarchaeota archaeon]|nr:hypothetical protein [Candidatus Lokiarchaeota archaeon]